MIHTTSQAESSNANLVKFSNLLKGKTKEGFVVVERNDKLPYAVLLKKKKKVNHIYNFAIFCATLGLWSFVWIYITQVSSKAKKILISIDEDGNPFEEKCYMG
ncbi:hypothetical protein FVB9288_00888 [Flavobacterium sp. CECT 9288]|jgi:hypothetical protein|uniref:hypothetical protein n=1 Tax=unclassified Flavobacterium TaxID=196869 RepID=UPI000A373FED|nr:MULTISPECIES: hypothetical protein [unclassified Flavobacterium]OUD28619.1 hypothetical protein FPG59_16065 [Flavobacterium sp. FPG59]CAH0335254.1 hypothetical protein FVB9288_00888 [Flavobacterium sp. CECT 9288]